jgi:hypothetical protein
LPWESTPVRGKGIHRAQPRQDLDLASFGVVRMLEGGPGTGYQGLGWEPKLAFTALAELP